MRKTTEEQKILLAEEFSEAVGRAILDYLPTEYADSELEFFTMRRLNDSYNAMRLNRRDFDGPLPVLNLDVLYDAYYNGMPWIDVMKTAADVLQMTSDIELEKYFDYTFAREHLIIRVSSWEQNRDLAGESPFLREGSIMLTYHAVHTDPDGETATMRINNDILQGYGISMEQLHKDAVANSQRLLPPSIMSLDDLICDLSRGKNPRRKRNFCETVAAMHFRRENVYVLSNTACKGGAAVIFYPDVLKLIADKAGCDLYILPSSVHEVLIVLSDSDADPVRLKEIVMSVNREKILNGIKLSDSVFVYSRQNGQLKEYDGEPG